MKIVIVLGAFFPVPPIMGGALEKVWWDLAREFARRGHDVTLISRKLETLLREETIEGVRHLRVPGFNSPRSRVLLKIYDLLYSFRVLRRAPSADVTVTNTFWLPLLRPGFYVHVGRFPKGQMRFYAGARRLQAPSNAVGRAIRDEAPALADKVTVIPYPAPTPMIDSPPPAIAARAKIILYVGRVHPEKGVHLLVDAFVNARTVFADWRLVIVGPAEESYGGGGEAYLRTLQSSADDRVTFRGGVFDPAELERTFRAAPLFVYPSLAERGESFGLAPLEAMTHGCAVAVSKLNCFEDFVADGKTGFVFDHRSAEPAEALRQTLQRAISDPDLMSRVARNGLDQSAEYSLARVAGRFLDDFEIIARG